MSNEKKLFLDYSGLVELWNKIKNTFYTKSDANNEFSEVYSEVSNINKSINSINEEIDGIEQNITSITPIEVNNYDSALNAAKTLVPGTIIKVNKGSMVNGATYIAGFYVVYSNDPKLEYIGTSTGSADDDKVAALEDKVAALEESVITSVAYGVNGTLNEYEIINNSLIIKYDDEFVANSASINALTHKAIAAKFGDIEDKLSGIPHFKIDVVDELPQNEISTSTIYLKRNSEENGDNLYIEYIYLENKGWEKLGEQTLNISNFLTEDQLEAILNNKQYVTRSEVNNIVNDEISNIAGSLNSFVKYTELDDLVLTSITTGSVGEGMSITIEDINNLN